MAHRDIVVIGTSAGGLEALRTILAALPANFDAAILIVLHTTKHSGSLLPAVLGRVCKLPVSHPQDGTPLRSAQVYVAPPGCHMTVADGVMRVTAGPRENLHCPAIDPLFRSAAVAYGPRVIGVILTGMMNDGTSGLMTVAACGGETVVEDPETALFPSMPTSALGQVPGSRVVPLANLANTLKTLVETELPAERQHQEQPSPVAEKENRFAELDMDQIASEKEHPGSPSSFACPDCGGVLWEIEQENFLRFRCRVGHAFTAMYLAAEQQKAIETALWEALRALQESSSLFNRLAERARSAGRALAANSYEERASDTDTHSRTLRNFLLEVNMHEDDAGPE